MARKKRIADQFILGPWWLGLVVAAAIYFLLPLGLNRLPADNPLLQILAKVLPPLIPYASLLLVVFSAISAMRAWATSRVLENQHSLDSLSEVPWKTFEDLIAEVYRRMGYSVEETLGGGPDGGIDLILRRGEEKSLVQCKRWRNKSVGGPVVRELFGTMVAGGAGSARLVTTSAFTPDAIAFAKGKRIELIDGTALLTLLSGVQKSGRITASVSPGTSVPTTSPSCPKCGAGMQLRTARKGSSAGSRFWGCSNYPRCTETRSLEVSA